VSFLDENRRALARHHPEVFDGLEASGAAVASDARIVPTRSGVPTLIVDGLHYHSGYDPRREAAAAVAREVDPSATTIIVLGFGLGYAAEAAKERFPLLPMVVVEPDREVFRAALTCRDFTGFLARPDVTLWIGEGPEGLPRVLENVPLARPAFLRLRPAYRGRPVAYRAAEETVRSWLLRRDINTNTLARFGRLWVRNLCRNLRFFADSPGIGLLAGTFDGIPALVTAGGPTLDAVLPLLSDLRERMLVVSVNTPLRACLAAGVEPDFTVVVDPQYWASRYLDWTSTRRGILIAEPSTCPRVFHRTDAASFFCSSLFPLGETLEEATGVRGRLGAGGSVATAAWDFARLLGCRPLYAAGLDLGFPGMRTHCRGVFAEDAWVVSASRLSPVEGSSWSALRDIGLFPARSATGGSTPTDRRMLLYKWWFENQLRGPSAPEAYTLSGDGVEIQGMQVASRGDLLSLPSRRAAIEERMIRVRALHENRPPLRESAAALRAALDRVITGLEELGELARRGREESARLDAAVGLGSGPGPHIAALEEIDRRILGLSARTIAGFLIQSLIHRITGEGDTAGGAREVAARSVEMYDGIAESAGWQIRLLRRAEEELHVEEGLQAGAAGPEKRLP
jgi:hypothetical protein